MAAMETTKAVFLKAEWRHLAMLNYVIDPALLASRVPAGCELDFFAGRTFVSVVGFLFLDTRVLGVPIPFHRDFEEVNLRFYVRHKAEDGAWRRGVVFVKELVPRWAIAFVARTLYGENYEALPMRHELGKDKLAYQWRRQGRWEGLSARFSGEPAFAPEEAEETFIAEHYWGYARQRGGGTVEYQVEHPPWRVWRATDASFEANVATLYGPEFVETLAGTPSSAFIAEGSEIIVRQGRRLAKI